MAQDYKLPPFPPSGKNPDGSDFKKDQSRVPIDAGALGRPLPTLYDKK